MTRQELEEIAAKVGKIKELSVQGFDVFAIADKLGYEIQFVSDVLITISGSPEDDSDMAIAYLLTI